MLRLLKMIERLTRPRKPEFLNLKIAAELTDDELLTLISNDLDWSIDQTIIEAANQINSDFTPDKYWKTLTLPFEIRAELRKAHGILNIGF